MNYLGRERPDPVPLQRANTYLLHHLGFTGENIRVIQDAVHLFHRFFFDRVFARHGYKYAVAIVLRARGCFGPFQVLCIAIAVEIMPGLRGPCIVARCGKNKQ